MTINCTSSLLACSIDSTTCSDIIGFIVPSSFILANLLLAIELEKAKVVNNVKIIEKKNM